MLRPSSVSCLSAPDLSVWHSCCVMTELADDPLLSDGLAHKRSNGRPYGSGGGAGSGGGLFDGLRRTFANLMRPQTASASHRKSPDLPVNTSRAAYLRQNATLPRKIGSTQSRVIIEEASPGHILVSERLVLPTDSAEPSLFPLTARSSHSAAHPFSETPMPVRAELIKLDTLSGGSGQLLSRKDRENHGHSFCAIPLEVDTFCDFCNQPIWGLGWGPVCQRCADCHMTCHWLCTDKVTVCCESSPPPVRPSTPSDSLELDRESTPPEPPILGDSTDIFTESSSNYKQINSPFMPEFSPPQKDILTTGVSPTRPPQTRASSCDPGPPSPHSRSHGHAVRSNDLSCVPLVSASASSSSAFTANNVQSREIRTFTYSPSFNPSRRASDVGSPLSHRPGLSADDQPPRTLASSTLRPTSQCSLFASTDTSFSHLHETNRSPSAAATVLTSPTSRDPDVFKLPSTNDRLDEVLEHSDEESSSSTSVLMPPSPPGLGVTMERSNETGVECSEEPTGTSVSRVDKMRPHPGQLSKPPLPTGASGLNRSSLHQSILRYPAMLDGGKAERRSVRRHASMLANFPYDISSLDHKDIAQRGIRVRQLSPKRDVAAHFGASVKDLGSSTSRSNPSSATSSPTKEGMSGVELVMSSLMQATQVAALSDHPLGLDVIHFSKVAIGPRDTLPWSPVELAQRIDIFNTNEFGLTAKMTPRLPPGDCEGQIRVHINLIRPVRMVLSSRPASIFDVVGDPNEAISGSSSDEDEAGPPTVDGPSTADQPPSDGTGDSSVRMRRSLRRRVTSFRLPRGSSKLIHVRLSTPAQQVITSLLRRFSIDDNPQKFALYEHTIVSDQEVSVRKLFDNESPLGLFLRWTSGGKDPRGLGSQLDVCSERFNRLLASKRLVLQENETGNIEWSCFSTAELQNFLQILNREEADYRRRIQLKYEIRGREIRRLMKLRAKSNPRNPEELSGTSEAGDAAEASGVQDGSPKRPDPSAVINGGGEDINGPQNRLGGPSEEFAASVVWTKPPHEGLPPPPLPPSTADEHNKASQELSAESPPSTPSAAAASRGVAIEGAGKHRRKEKGGRSLRKTVNSGAEKPASRKKRTDWLRRKTHRSSED
ncbi:negative regulation of cell cycle arrest [Sparganum proliferum]